MNKYCLIGLNALVFVISCDSEKMRFSRLTPSETGVDFVNVNVENEQINIFTYEYLYNGGGVSVGDINNDGYSDIYFTSNNQSNRLYLNRGNFKFEDITEISGVGCQQGWKTGSTMVDINSDGFLDIYVCRSADSNPERRRNSLLINNGNLTFTDRASEYGLDDDSYSTQSAFFDYDRDGDLDMFLLNHSLLQISNSFNVGSVNQYIRYPYVGNKLFRNDNGKFNDVSELAGIYGPSSNYGLGLAIADLNNDNWPDIYFTNDYVDKDRALINNKNGAFIDATDSLFTHMSQFSMGLDIADINNDGWADIGTLDMLPEDNKRQKLLFAPDRYDVYQRAYENGYHRQFMRNMLQLNNMNGSFSEIGQLAGVSNTDWSWSLLFADYDNDGSQDIMITNGYKRDFTNVDFLKYRADQEMKGRQGSKSNYLEMITKIPVNKPVNYLFRNEGNLTFENVQTKWGFTEATLSNGAAYSDLDNDGDLDLIINNIDEPASLYRNNTELTTDNRFVKIRLSGAAENVHGIGAKVSVWTKGQRQTRWQFLTRGFQSSVDPVIHFGIDKKFSTIDSIVVEWPSHLRSRLINIEPNQTLIVLESNAKRESVALTINEAAIFVKEPALIDFVHRESEYVDFKVQALLPKFYSKRGPAIAIGDVDGNGTGDVFVGGGLGQSSELYLLSVNGKFNKSKENFDQLLKTEVNDCEFVDVDKDLDLDLVLVGGSYEFVDGVNAVQDQVYINDGAGRFTPKIGSLPNSNQNSTCVRSFDFDIDGDLDLFIGGGVLPGKYPLAAKSKLLINNGNGNFKDKTEELAAGLSSIGIVNDATWTDVNGDGRGDLIIVGEWIPISVFINDGGKLMDRSAEYFESSTSGWWNAIASADIDLDGDSDFIVGNQGVNNQMRSISIHEPVRLVYSDFDNNGSIDPILTYFIQGEEFPYPNRDELTDQLPFLKKRFSNYESYSIVGLDQIFNKGELIKSKQLSVNTFHSICLINESGKKLAVKPLPIQAQFAPIEGIFIGDVNGDRKKDLILAGNHEATRVRTGIYSANNGFLFLGNGAGDFKYVNQALSGLDIRGAVKKIKFSDGRLFFAINNSGVQVYSKSF